MNKLITAISDYQREQGLSDVQLADFLEIDQSTLSRIKAGERSPGKKVLRAIATRLPNLRPIVFDYLENGDGRHA